MQTYKVTVDNEGTICWYNEKSEFHRLDGPAVEYQDENKFYYVNNELHREGGPAVEYPDGYKAYWFNGKLHREDGPAIEYLDGTKAYWINDEELTEEQFFNRNKKELTVKQIEDLLGYSIKIVKE